MLDLGDYVIPLKTVCKMYTCVKLTGNKDHTSHLDLCSRNLPAPRPHMGTDPWLDGNRSTQQEWWAVGWQAKLHLCLQPPPHHFIIAWALPPVRRRNKYNTFESSHNHSPTLLCGKPVFHKIGPWCQKIGTATVESMTLLGSEVHLQTFRAQAAVIQPFPWDFPKLIPICCLLQGHSWGPGEGPRCRHTPSKHGKRVNDFEDDMRTMKATVYLKAKA